MFLCITPSVAFFLPQLFVAQRGYFSRGLAFSVFCSALPRRTAAVWVPLSDLGFAYVPSVYLFSTPVAR